MLDTIKNILINYWQPIIAVIIFIVSFILQLIKKKPFKVVDSVTSFIFYQVIEIINRVEAMANGAKWINFRGVITPKIDVALTLMKEMISQSFPNIDPNSYDLIIRYAIEDILSTPQKKGVTASEKKTHD